MRKKICLASDDCNNIKVRNLICLINVLLPLSSKKLSTPSAEDSLGRSRLVSTQPTNGNLLLFTRLSFRLKNNANMQAGSEQSKQWDFLFIFLTACEEVREAFQTAAQTLFQLHSVVSSVRRSADDPPYYSVFPQYKFPHPVEKCSELSHWGELSLNQWALLDSWRIRETRTPLWSCLGQQSLIHMDFWGI